MNLHGQIMNMTADAGNASTDSTRIAYLEGHRDARYVAAELAISADADRHALIEVAQNALGAYEALRLFGADKHLPGHADCERRLKAVLARVGEA